MAPFVVRRSERIDYRVPVTLFPTRENVAPVIARSMDVSEGGMRVLAPIPVPVGATVRCELTIDGRSAVIEGKVAWLADQALDAVPGLGMGIRFEVLTREDTGVLRHLVARATEGYMPAELELPGVRNKVAARAVPTSNGARISASLPWLRRGASVGVRFVGAPADVHGRIGDAVLRELPSGGRRLQFEVEADAPQRERRDTRYGDALDFERPRGDTITADPVKHSFEPAPPHARAWLPWVGGAMLGSATTLAMLALLWPHIAATPGGAPRTARVHAAQPLAAMISKVEQTPAPQAPAQPREAVIALAPVEAKPQATFDTTSSSTSRGGEALQPTVEAQGDASIVRIPFSGTLEGMNARIWAEPYALAIDLPAGETALAPGRYALDPASGAAFLRVQARSNALQLRVGLTRPLITHQATNANGLLEVRIVSRAQPTSEIAR